jgi:hypothetical protein
VAPAASGIRWCSKSLAFRRSAIITTEFEKETVLTRTAIGMQGLIPVAIAHAVSSITHAEVEYRRSGRRDSAEGLARSVILLSAPAQTLSIQAVGEPQANKAPAFLKSRPRLGKKKGANHDTHDRSLSLPVPVEGWGDHSPTAGLLPPGVCGVAD